MTQPIPLLTKEANLKRSLRAHLKSLGFEKDADGNLRPAGESKELIKMMHSKQREEKFSSQESFATQELPQLISYFASGCEIDPYKISPRLQLIKTGSWEAKLFRLASLIWSVPVSNGFGRRLRYLVWDNQNDKLMGLIAIGDPVFNLSVRDRLIGWNSSMRSSKLVNIMDAYVLGSVPPYNSLLVGKLVACLLRSRDLYDDFENAYGGSTGIISQKSKNARLLAVTTSSSMGRSSVYNRLKLNNVSYMKSIGYTGGWGHFHIPESLFQELRIYLREKKGVSYADQHEFGNGPNWRLRTTREALSLLGFKEDMLKHGIQREVFISQLAVNSISILKGGSEYPDLSSLLNVREISEQALQRWVIPRSLTTDQYKHWNKNDIVPLIHQKLDSFLKNSSIDTLRFA